MGEYTIREILKRRSEETLRRIQQRRQWRQKHGKKGRWKWITGFLFLGLCLALAAYGVYLDGIVTKRFESGRWSLPARVYARPLELYPGMALGAAALERELRRLGYRKVDQPGEPGTYLASGETITFVTRPFRFWDGSQPALAVRAMFRGSELVSLGSAASGDALTLARLDPPLIGSIFPRQGEDRILVRLDEVPPLLRAMLIAVEDRRFYEHHGVDARALARATAANVEAGTIVEGGSTLTQQLVKNYFLGSERSFKRKFDEIIMALSLDLHYSKDEILEAYLNEIYLGQDGPRAIHGVGLASYFYFHKPVGELELHEAALLVALVRGPSHYDPRRQPERARERRDLVLDIAAEQGVIAPSVAERARARPLGVVARPPQGTSYYPAFMDLVKEQLKTDYEEERLYSEGLQIFTTLDPLAQLETESAVADAVTRVEQARGLPAGSLEAAAIVINAERGEVVAIVGGRNPRYPGFNRALTAVRPIGSLVKPFVYLRALSQPQRYTLATLVDDSPLEVGLPDGNVWRPVNDDGGFRGKVPLYEALAHSYNLPAVRVGLDIGVAAVVQQLNAAGFGRSVNAYPSLLLGAVAMSPFEVAQLYATLAAGGFRTRLSAIREVLAADGTPLERRSLIVEPAADPASVYLVNRALVLAVREGTGRPLGALLPEALVVAGKTGTTDDFRDSWFAGFSGDRTAVVWLGRDDNAPVGLTGASGALPVWGAVMRAVARHPFAPAPPESVVEIWVDRETGAPSREGCANAIALPFVAGSEPAGKPLCRDTLGSRAARLLREVFN